MKKGYIALILITVAAGYIFTNIYFSRTTVSPFNAKPATCEIISNSLSLIPKAKLETTYKNMVTIYREYSPDKHLERHPNDVAIRTDPGDKSNVVVILTNNDPYAEDYFVSKNVALATK